MPYGVDVHVDVYPLYCVRPAILASVVGYCSTGTIPGLLLLAENPEGLASLIKLLKKLNDM